MKFFTQLKSTCTVGLLVASMLTGCGGSSSHPITSQPEPKPLPEPVAQDLDYQALLDAAISDNVPGMVLLVDTATDRHWVSAGVTDTETLEPMPLDARMPIGSVGKTLVAALVTVLVDEGWLDLDSPIKHYLGDTITEHLAYSDIITLRQLLNHTAGVRDYLNHPLFLSTFLATPDDIWLDEDLLPFILDREPDFYPGSQFKYSNTGYVLVGMVISAVLEEHSSHALNARILAPLGMDATRYLGLETTQDDIVSGYRDLMEFDLAVQPTIGNLRPHLYRLGVSDAPVASTVDDLAKWQYALQNANFLPGKSLLSAMTHEQSLITLNGIGGYLPNSDIAYGLGMFKETAGDTTLFHHGGDQFGWLTHNVLWPEKNITIALMVNCGGDICEEAAASVVNQIITHYQ